MDAARRDKDAKRMAEIEQANQWAREHGQLYRDRDVVKEKHAVILDLIAHTRQARKKLGRTGKACDDEADVVAVVHRALKFAARASRVYKHTGDIGRVHVSGSLVPDVASARCQCLTTWKADEWNKGTAQDTRNGGTVWNSESASGTHEGSDDDDDDDDDDTSSASSSGADLSDYDDTAASGHHRSSSAKIICSGGEVHGVITLTKAPLAQNDPRDIRGEPHHVSTKFTADSCTDLLPGVGEYGRSEGDSVRAASLLFLFRTMCGRRRDFCHATGIVDPPQLAALARMHPNHGVIATMQAMHAVGGAMLPCGYITTLRQCSAGETSALKGLPPGLLTGNDSFILMYCATQKKRRELCSAILPHVQEDQCAKVFAWVDTHFRMVTSALRAEIMAVYHKYA
jgi:hypothetical protein